MRNVVNLLNYTKSFSPKWVPSDKVVFASKQETQDFCERTHTHTQRDKRELVVDKTLTNAATDYILLNILKL